MKEWPELPRDRELERADDLLDQADALLRRHHARNEARTDAADAWAPAAGLDSADLPILTEVVDPSELPLGWSERDPDPLIFDSPPAEKAAPVEAPPSPAHAPPPPAPAFSAAESAVTTEDRVAYQIAERLIELDTLIARSINDWMDQEFPQILQRELDNLSERLQVELQAHLRATLQPELSAHISRQMERSPDLPPPLRS